MKNPVSLNGVKGTSRGCQAKACKKLGSIRSFVDPEKHCKWTYGMCDEHFVLLTISDKRYIARTEGTKST